MNEKPRSAVLPSQRQKIIEVLVAAGLVPSDFEWCDIESESGNSEQGLLIKHGGRDYYCKVDHGHGSTWDIEYCPATETEWTNSVNAYWDSAIRHVEKWAKRVSVELAAEDYVQLAINNQQLLRLPGPDEESVPLTDIERDLLVERMETIESYLLGLRSDSTEFSTQVRASMVFLKEQAKKSDRRAIYALVFSTMLAIGLQFLTSTETKEAIEYATTQINIEVSSSTHVINNVLLKTK